MGERTSGPLKALLVVGWRERVWPREIRLPFAPSPGTGIRLDAYDMVKVDGLVVGDLGQDVTCIRTWEDGAAPADERRVRELGFEEGGYP